MDLLKYVGVRSTNTPESFTIHKHLLKTFCDARVKKIESGTGIDWATAEALAIGTLLMQGWSLTIAFNLYFYFFFGN